MNKFYRRGNGAVLHTCVCQRESPQTQVTGRVGDAAKTVFDRVDCLMDEDLPKVELQTDVVKMLYNFFSEYFDNNLTI